MNTLDRRSFLLASGALILAACASDESSSSGQLPSDAPEDGYILARRFSTEVLVPGRQRLPFSLADPERLLSDGPPVLTGRIENEAGAIVVPELSATQRRVTEGLVYWDFHTELTETGIYTLYIEGGTADGGPFQINDPTSVILPAPGQTLPGLDTPTTADPRGVNPICTRLAGPCPFHALTLTEALASGKPVAYVIGTPAHCQIGSCAPGLESLIVAAERLGDALAVVHAEVYVDDKAVDTTAAIEAFDLAFEPLVFLTDADGVISDRLDVMWDQSELDEALDRLIER